MSDIMQARRLRDLYRRRDTLQIAIDKEVEYLNSDDGDRDSGHLIGLTSREEGVCEAINKLLEEMGETKP